MKRILFALLMLVILNANAQEKVPYQDCDEIIEEANQLMQNDSYHAAYEKMTEINENDSCYIRSLINRTYFLLNDPDQDDDIKYNEVIRLTQQSIDSDLSENKYLHYFNQIAAYINLKDYEKALSVIDTALVIYPKKAELYVRKGVVFDAQEEYTLAAEAYKQSLIINPFDTDAHLKMGLLCYRSDKITQALMCFDLYLSLLPDGEFSSQTLELANHMVSSKYDEDLIEVVVSKDDKAFEDLDLLIKNEIALQAKYKVKNKLGDLPIVKQNHLMLDQLKSFEGNGGFFEKKYVPFFTNINLKNMFDQFCYTICYGVQNPKYKKITQSKINEVKSFNTASFSKVVEMYNENEIIIDGVKKKVYFEYSIDGVSGIGKKKNGLAVDDWVFYNNPDGFVLSEGNFNNTEKKEGKWTWYYENGKVRIESFFKNGLNHGTYKEFHPSGQLNYILDYENGVAKGVFRRYNRYGALIEEKTFKQNKMDGPYKEFYGIGENYKNIELNYVKGIVEGLVTEYYSNGQKKMEANFSEDKRNGIEKTYYSNGQLKSEINYLNNLYNGDFVNFYSDGKKYSEGSMNNGEPEGKWIYYHHNGEIETSRTFVNGKLDGEYLKYDLDGILEYKQIYKRDNLMEVFSYDKSGVEFYSDKKKKGELFFRAYSPYGVLTAEGLYDLEGGKEGEWKYYNKNGVLTSKANYSQGLLEGSEVYYYSDGTEEIFSTYKDNKLEGYYYEKHKNGNLSFQGWYKEGAKQGVFYSYYPNGEISDSYYYVDGSINGEQIDYGINGNITNITVYDMGDIETTIFYNNDGEVFENHVRPRDEKTEDHYFYSNGEKRSIYEFNYGRIHGSFESFYPGGNKRSEGSYNMGERDGKWTWYFENGQVDTETYYILGEIDGIRKEYHPNGQLAEESFYIMGKVHGENKSYNNKGILTNISNYEYGVNHGKRYFYSEDGKLQLIRVYNNDFLVGYTYLSEDGKELPVIPIENETVKITAYFDNGKVSREMNIVKGLFEGEYNSYYYSGQLQAKSIYAGDKREGVVKRYFSDGKLMSEKEYLNDQAHGSSKEYFESGKLKSQGYYQYGLSHGDFMKYSKDGKVLSNRAYQSDIFISNN